MKTDEELLEEIRNPRYYGSTRPYVTFSEPKPMIRYNEEVSTVDLEYVRLSEVVALHVCKDGEGFLTVEDLLKKLSNYYIEKRHNNEDSYDLILVHTWEEPNPDYDWDMQRYKERKASFDVRMHEWEQAELVKLREREAKREADERMLYQQLHAKYGAGQ